MSKEILEENLRESSCNGDIDNVSKLISMGVDVNSQNKINGWTALHWASKRGHTLIVKVLLKANADPNIKNNKGKIAADLCVAIEKSLMPNLEEKNNITQLTETKKFIPNYLKHPPFPYTQQSSKINSTKSVKLLEHTGFYYKVESIRTTNATTWTPSGLLIIPDTIVFKVRLSGEKYFTEISFARETDVSFNVLVETCMRHLKPKLSITEIKQIIKLPNTIITNDMDVKRLTDYQCLEIPFDTK